MHTSRSVLNRVGYAGAETHSSNVGSMAVRQRIVWLVHRTLIHLA